MLEILITLVITALIVIISGFVVKQTKLNSERNAIINQLNQKGNVIKHQKRYFFEFKQKTYPLLLLRINHNQRLCVNSRTILEIKTAKGNKYLDLSKYLTPDQLLLIIVYPKPGPYLRYLNESDMDYVSSFKPFWNMLVVDSSHLEEVFVNESN